MNPGISLMMGTKPSSTCRPTSLGSVTPSIRLTEAYIASRYLLPHNFFEVASNETMTTCMAPVKNWRQEHYLTACLYSPRIREGSFSETGLPLNVVLGNPERVRAEK